MKYARTGLAACVVLALAACGNKPAPLTPQEKHAREQGSRQKTPAFAGERR
jgi:predicted small lipoprotein YifL